MITITNIERIKMGMPGHSMVVTDITISHATYYFKIYNILNMQSYTIQLLRYSEMIKCMGVNTSFKPIQFNRIKNAGSTLLYFEEIIKESIK